MSKVDHNEVVDYSYQKIVDVNLEKEVKKSFIDYSMSVITSRALPDVRDGMKPGQRRILYAMYEDHLTYDKPFRKSATTVGNVLGHYHPHGDSSVYGSMVRMAQKFSLRYPLIEGHGNFGNVDGDPPAAYRYTEARMAKISDYMLSDIEKDVVDFVPNFDNKLKEPVVLPSRFPNLLVNGTVGIAVGMATNIPPHNLNEVIDGIDYLLDKPDATLPEIMNFIKGPDFPTAATIYGTSGIYRAYQTGKGRIAVRAKAEVDEEKHRIIVTEIPYAVNKSMLVENIANLIKDKRVEGVTALRDESGKAGMRIVIEFRRDANGQIILNQLYKYTQLQDTFAVNMLALVNGEPKILPLMDILRIYIKFQEDIVYRRTRFELEKALREQHILEGYIIATDNIDRVIEIIKHSESIPAAKEALSAEFALSDVQTDAIVQMTLGRLTGLERQKIEDRLAKIVEFVAECRAILADENKVKEIIKNELAEIKSKFGDARRTEILEAEDEILLEDLIERHTCVITMTHAGYVKRQPSDTYQSQRRGGKGIIGMTTKDEDFIENVVVSDSHSLMMFFTSKGKVYTKKAYNIPEASRTAKGTNIINLIEIEKGEKLTAMVPISSFAEDEYLLMVTKQGVVKRTPLSEFEYQRKTGKKALTLDEGDELVFVKHTTGDCNIIIATHEGNAVRYEEETIRPMGRGARGVRGILIEEEGDYVCGVSVVEEGKKLLTITENGYGKRTEYDDYRVMKHRGGKGATVHSLTAKTGKLASIVSVSDGDDVMMITDAGTVVRTDVSEIPVYSRTASGVIVMRMAEGTKLANFAAMPKNKDEDADAETEAASADAPVAENAAESAAEKAPTADIEEAIGEAAAANDPENK